MPFIDPRMYKEWGLDGEIERICREMTVWSKTYFKDVRISRLIGMKQPELFDDWLDVSFTKYAKRKRKNIISTQPGVIILPKINKNGVSFHLKKLSLF